MIKISPEAKAPEAAQDQDLHDDFAVFDLESAPLDDVTLAALCPPCEMPTHPGEFDPAAVKYGTTKDPVKRAEKLAEVKSKHEAAVKEYDQTVATAAKDHFQKFKDKAALDATTGRVVAIGVSPCPVGGNGPAIINCDGDSEESGLKLFWEWVEGNLKAQRPMIGWNSNGFDLPFLVRRSWILGVPIPIGVRKGRYFADLFIDLMQTWACGSRDYFKLDAAAAAFGLTGKVKEVAGDPIEGKTFYLAWRDPKRRKTAEKYLMADLRIPAELAKRMGVV